MTRPKPPLLKLAELLVPLGLLFQILVCEFLDSYAIRKYSNKNEQ